MRKFQISNFRFQIVLPVFLVLCCLTWAWADTAHYGNTGPVVNKWNGRSGTVMPQPGDYNAYQVGLGNVPNSNPFDGSTVFTDIKTKGPWADVRAYGAKGDGVTDDTAAIQNAINALGVNGGTIFMPGTYKFGALTLPALNNALVFLVKGEWVLTSTFNMPDHVAVIGQGGGQPAQFQRINNIAEINASNVANGTGIYITGDNDHLLKNLRIVGATGKDIFADGSQTLGALLEMDNVDAEVSSAGAIPFYDDTFFWVWAKNCVFNSETQNGGPSMYFTSHNTAYQGYAGEVYISDTMLSYQGVEIAPVSASSMNNENFSFRNMMYENGFSDFLIINTPSYPVKRLTLDNVEIQDERAGGITYVNNQGSGTVADLVLRNCTLGGAFMRGNPIQNIIIDNPDSYTTMAGENFDPLSQLQEYTALFGGSIDSRWAGNGMNFAPSIQPYTPVNINQNPSSWSGTSVNVAVVNGPDGLADAGLVNTAANDYIHSTVWSGSMNLAVGDWVIAGAWVQGQNGYAPGNYTGMAGSDVEISFPSGFTFDSQQAGYGGAPYFSILSPYTMTTSGGWQFASTARKVTSVGTNPAGMAMKIYVSPTGSLSVYLPWMIRIPAGTMSDAEVHRLTRYLVNIFSSAPAGSVATDKQIASVVANGTAPFSIISNTPVSHLAATPTTYMYNGTQQTNQHIVTGSAALSGGTATVTLTGAAVFTSNTSYTCTANDVTALDAVEVTETSGASITFTGNATDSVNYICVGN